MIFLLLSDKIDRLHLESRIYIGHASLNLESR